MSQIFHKSCYTARSSGYKYRTLSTNTGEKKRRDSKEDSVFDRKFRELQDEIACRIDKQVKQTQKARNTILENFKKIDAKINLMLELKDTVTTLRKNISVAENTLAIMVQKIERLDAVVGNDAYILKSRKSSFRSQPAIFEKDEISNLSTNNE